MIRKLLANVDKKDGNTGVMIGGVPASYSSMILRELAFQKKTVLFVAEDDAEATRLATAMEFFAPDVDRLLFPAWDCLPYDRVSPHKDVLAHRLDTLFRLSKPVVKNRVVLTSVAALLQRVPPPKWIAKVGMLLKPGMIFAPNELQKFLQTVGYRHVGTVDEPGEFSQRGGIFDLFPTGSDSPVRLDYFGDEIEQIKSFDVSNQRSLDALQEIRLLPANELELDDQSIERFRTSYRGQFGSGDDDPLYEAISSRRLYPGMEHWLPLFRHDLVTLFAYVEDALLCFSRQAEEAKSSRLETIDDFYQARHGMRDAQKRINAPVYKPLPPSMLYVTDAEWKAQRVTRPSVTFHPGAAPDHEGWIEAGARIVADFAPIRANPDLNLYDEAIRHVRAAQKAGQKVLLVAGSNGASERLGQVLREHGLDQQQSVTSIREVDALPTQILARAVVPLEKGFSSESLLVLTDQDILGDRLDRGRSGKKRKAGTLLAELANFEAGEFVVHQDHGIGRYDGLETLDIGGAPHDCLKLVYHGGDRVFLPVENIDMLSRYGGEDAPVELDRLGGTAWQARKAHVKKRIREMANKLIAVAAQRAVTSLEPVHPQDGIYAEFCAGFPYAETEDQQRAIEEVLADLAAGTSMDRLVCGDVGFGKTEVALRAAFVVAAANRQVAVLAPTTLLARQHYATFRQRFASFPIRIAQLSRLTGVKESKIIRHEITEGKIDIAIGTHALLAKDIRFKNLGLIIVDEEQHFGVAQKEKLKELKEGLHVLTLTATPIPRTLQLALSGMREMSLIATPPIDRLAVRTFVLPFDPVILREAMMREHFRGGQIFYVCPRIEEMERVEANLRELVPELKIVTAHGRISPAQLEKAMNSFYDGGYDLLLSTHIIESGLDIPRANTMIIHRADLFGLAQLYQLRGRIGRSKLRGYCYLTIPTDKVLNPTAQRRLDVMQSLDQLGAGFALASQDMDIRGSGNLLGEEQSGQIHEVGVELYQQMLKDAVATAKRGTAAAKVDQDWSPTINLGMSVLIPEDYVKDLGVRLGLYRRLGDLHVSQDIDGFAAEMIDRFGAIPESFGNLLSVVEIKALCKAVNVEKLEAGPKGALLAFRRKTFAEPAKLIDVITKSRGRMTIRPDQRLVVHGEWQSPKARRDGSMEVLKSLKALL